jgi:LuxR family maltose regulon positive regulatory protein
VVGERRSRQAVELAQRHGWGEDQAAGVAYAMLGGALVGQGRLAEAEPWLDRAGQTLRTEAVPAAGMFFHYSRGVLELVLGRNEALADFRATEQLAGTLVTPHALATSMRAHMVQALVGLGQTERAEAALAGLDEEERASAEMRAALASLRLAQHDPESATAALAPVIDGSVPAGLAVWMVTALLLEAIARDALGDQAATGRALERALDAAEPDHPLIPFLIHPAPGLLERHARQRTAHPVLIAEILSLLPGCAGAGSPSQGGSGGMGPPGRNSSGGLGGTAPPEKTLREPLSRAETRVLRYLPTNLTVPEIADQIYLSGNTVRTHMRHIYAKLGAHRRQEAVERARALGLLAPSAQRP